LVDICLIKCDNAARAKVDEAGAEVFVHGAFLHDEFFVFIDDKDRSRPMPEVLLAHF
jgi:hypothetical protein